MDPKLDFGQLLEKYLDEQGRSGSWLAERLGTSRTTVNRWRNGVTLPKDAETVGRVAEVLSVPGDERDTFFDSAGYLYVEEIVEEGERGLDEDIKSTRLVQETFKSPPEPDHYPQESSPKIENGDSKTETTIRPAQIETNRLSRRDLLILALGMAFTMTIIMVTASSAPVNNSPVDVRRFAIGELQNLSPDSSSLEGQLLHDTRRILYQKLSVVKGLEGVFWDMSPATPEARKLLDLWIEGAYKKLDEVELSATIFGGPEKTFLKSVSAQAEVDERRPGVEICILDVQTKLAKEIVVALGLEINEDAQEKLRQTPTASCEALNLNNDAVILASQGNFHSAIIKLQQALAHDPSYADAYSNLGWILRRQNEHEEAVQAAKAATELQPSHPLFWFNLGLAYEDAENLDDAVAAYIRATSLDPTYVKALNNLGYTYLLMGDLTQAAEQIQAGLEINSQAAYLHKNLGRIYLEQGRREEAIESLHQAIALFQPYTEALYYLLVAYDKLNNGEKACETWSGYRDVIDDDTPERQVQAVEISKKHSCD